MLQKDILNIKTSEKHDYTLYSSPTKLLGPSEMTDDDGEAFLPLPSVCHLRVLARTVGTGDTQVCPLLSCFGAIWQERPPLLRGVLSA